MGVELFPHNQSAYNASVCMMRETGRAAVIHPTGTGKSFIAFKLAEEHADRQCLWLSPSRYIFSAQQESYARATGETAPNNISYCTYARLAHMEPEVLEEIHPDFIILDEFHRCGAEEWGRGVDALLEQCPEACVLGLSATHIRYLDNQRDMADELFGGCVASEMTLGEAIARGILSAPRYVVSLYSCQEELEKYRRRMLRANGAARQAAEQYLEALRRALERAEGLDAIFKRHMDMPHGKYLVFCANQEHMREMIAKAGEWFSQVDSAPHIYAVYAEFAESQDAFERFMSDESDHLKLLYCINMLNEGIHIRGVNGVILLRPTVSPIVYKQQIGRALSASDSDEPVIFDIVNNFENLYSISAVEQEVREAVTLCRNRHDADAIVRERFEIIDEVRECRQLFERLEETLTLSWDLMYAQAEAYYRANGALDVPRRYTTPEGLPLGSWISTQRKARRGMCSGRLSQEQIARLDSIGMIWENCQELRWEKSYALARAYYEANGNLNVPADFITGDGFQLGRWLANQRQLRSGLNRRSRLSPERVARLDALGMVWNYADYAFERDYLAATAYYLEHGNLRVPANYVCENGFRLGAWINRLKDRHAGKDGCPPLTQEQIDRLDRIGMIWLNKYEEQWERAFAQAQLWYREKGNLNVPAGHSAGGVALGRWIARQRAAQQKGKLSEMQQARLSAIGMEWRLEDAWERNFREAERYWQVHKSLEIPADYVDANGSWLGKWVSLQRRAARDGKLSEVRQARLSAIGMRWQSTQEIQWESMYERAAQYAKQFGGINALKNDDRQPQLRLWYKRQCLKRRDGKLTARQVQCMEALEG